MRWDFLVSSRSNYLVESLLTGHLIVLVKFLWDPWDSHFSQYWHGVAVSDVIREIINKLGEDNVAVFLVYVFLYYCKPCNFCEPFVLQFSRKQCQTRIL
jgi:hypothetical protein